MQNLKRAFALSVDFSKADHISTDIKFKQFDYGGNEIGLQILYDDEAIVLDDEYVVAVYRDSKNNIVVDSNNRPIQSFARVYDLNEGLIIIPINHNVLKLTGNVDVELMIISSDGAKRLTSPKFNFEVVQSILEFDESDIQTREAICGLYKCGEVLCGRTTRKTSRVYAKNIWIDGETVIDAEKLNKIEDTLYNLSNNENIIQELLTRITTLEEKLDELQNNVPSKPPVSEGTDIEVVDNEMLINISDVSYDEHLEELTITHSKVTYIAEEQALIINKK